VIRTGSELWRGRLRVWVPALIFFVVAAGALGVYRLRFAGEAEVSEQSVGRARRALAELTEDSERLATDIERIRANREMLQTFYGDRLATESERLTRIIAEVKELARRSRMLPLAIQYPDQPIEDFGLRRRAFVFGVEGTYADLRSLLNLLELSESFLALEEVSLVEGSGGGGRLRISLRLSTLFAAEDAPLLEDARSARARNGAVPEATVPEETVPEETVPDETVPGEMGAGGAPEAVG
jgi:hypothetical protein